MMPVALVTGNHDLEGTEFETDEENLAAWSEAGSSDCNEDQAKGDPTTCWSAC